MDFHSKDGLVFMVQADHWQRKCVDYRPSAVSTPPRPANDAGGAGHHQENQPSYLFLSTVSGFGGQGGADFHCQGPDQRRLALRTLDTVHRYPVQ